MISTLLERPGIGARKPVRNLSVRLCTEIHDGRQWDEYVQESTEAAHEHAWAWRAILQNAFGFEPFYLGAFEDGTLVGILPLFRVPRGLKRTALISIPFGNYAGICASSEDAASALLQTAVDLSKQRGDSYLELRHKKAFDLKGLQEPVSKHSRFTRSLADSPEIIFKNLGTKLRNKIKKAQNSGLHVQPSRDLELLYKIHTRTSHRQGTPCFPKRYFAEILKHFGQRAEIHFLMHEDKAVAYLFNIYFKKQVVCQFNGSLTEYLNYKPNNLLYWYQVENGSARGAREIDHGRSRMDSGSASFKREIGLHEEPLHYQYYLPEGAVLPARNPSNPKLKLVIQTWQKLPLSLTVLAGPKVVKYFA